MSQYVDSDGVELVNKYVTKEYMMNRYPDLIPNMLTPELRSWGHNFYGQLGDNTLTGKSSPVRTAAGGTNWKQVSCALQHSVTIKTDGTLWSWGRNDFGQLGDNTLTGKSSPVQTAAGGTNWKQVNCGGYHTATIKTNGELWSWGRNDYGQLGDNTLDIKSSPVQITGGGTNWKQVSGGNNHTAAINTTGELWTWGWNAYGQLGDNTLTGKSSPVQITGGGTNWKQVAGGHRYTAAIKTNGELWSWGYNFYGQLGDTTTTDKSSPVQIAAGGNNWKQVECGFSHTAAIKTDGTLWTWGYNVYGELGNHATTNRSSPGGTIAGGNNWKQVSCGYAQTHAIKTDGTLWTWGYNVYGELGDNTTTNKSSPEQITGGGTNWKQVSGGFDFAAAISESEGW